MSIYVTFFISFGGVSVVEWLKSPIPEYKPNTADTYPDQGLMFPNTELRWGREFTDQLLHMTLTPNIISIFTVLTTVKT
jgi:hypothetical protein